MIDTTFQTTLTADMIEPDVKKYRAAARRDRPAWVGSPTNFRDFIVAILVEVPEASATYDQHGVLTGVQGIRLK